MNIKTTIGKTYAVTSPAECTITTPDGTLIAACPAGVQTIIVAPTAEIVVSDDAALITETFKEASAGSAAGGGASIQQENLTDTPEQTTLDNCDCYGMSCLAGHTGLLKNITLQTRDNRTVSAIPVYLKIWDAETKRLLATSLSKKTQTLGQPITWNFAPVNVTTGEQLLVTAHTEEEKHSSTYKTGAGLSLRVTPNGQPNTGLLAQNGTISPAEWIAIYTIVYKGGGETSVNGVVLAKRADLDAHTQDAVRHITAEERTAWNNKADASALASKVNTSTFNAHTGNSTVHITAEERTAWNALSQRITEIESKLASAITTSTIAQHAVTEIDGHKGPISLGSNLSMSGNTLSASSGGLQYFQEVLYEDEGIAMIQMKPDTPALRSAFGSYVAGVLMEPSTVTGDASVLIKPWSMDPEPGAKQLVFAPTEAEPSAETAVIVGKILTDTSK